MMWLQGRRRRWLTIIGSLLVVTLVAGACGGDEDGTDGAAGAEDGSATDGGSGTDDGDGGDGSGGSSEALTLRVAMSEPDPDAVDTFLAQELGFFEDENLTVEFVYADPPGSLLTAGRADMVDTSALPGVTLGLRDFPIRHFKVTKANEGFSLIVNPEIESLEELRNKEDCTFAIQPPGGNAHAWGAHFFEQLDLDHCETESYTDPGLAVQGLVAGRFDATPVSAGYAAEATGEGVRILSDALSEDYEQYSMPTPFLSGSSWTTQESLEENREALVRFTRAVVRAHRAREDELSREEVIDRLQDAQDVFAAQDAETIDLTLDTIRPFLRQDRISQDLWDTSLENFELFGIDIYDSTDERIQYDPMVDTSIFEEATASLD